MIHVYNGINLQEVYKTALYDLMIHGLATSPRGMETKEFIPGIIQIENPLSRIISLQSRKMNLFYAMIETLWYMNGDDEVAPLVHYNKRMVNFSDDGKTLHGAYGARLIKKNQTLDKSQFGLVYDKLTKDASSRQAVAIIWDPWRDHTLTKDVPCTIGFIFTIRENKLHMTTIMRSNDIVLGTTYDIFAFTMFQEFLARKLHVGLGPYTHIANSFHIYSNNYDLAWEMIKDNTPVIHMPEMPETKWDTFSRLYEFEKQVRHEKMSAIDFYVSEAEKIFDSYWAQWAYMIVLHKILKQKDKHLALIVHERLIPQYQTMTQRWIDKIHEQI